jgi:hypothetical protein
MSIDKKVNDAIRKRYETSSVEPCCIYLGHIEFMDLKQWVKSIQFVQRDINKIARFEYQGLAVFEVDADNHINVS